jgi:hypothetical protein
MRLEYVVTMGISGSSVHASTNHEREVWSSLVRDGITPTSHDTELGDVDRDTASCADAFAEDPKVAAAVAEVDERYSTAVAAIKRPAKTLDDYDEELRNPRMANYKYLMKASQLARLATQRTGQYAKLIDDRIVGLVSAKLSESCLPKVLQDIISGYLMGQVQEKFKELQGLSGSTATRDRAGSAIVEIENLVNSGAIPAYAARVVRDWIATRFPPSS